MGQLEKAETAQCVTAQTKAVYMLAMVAEVLQDAYTPVSLCHHGPDAAGRLYSCLVQPAVGPRCAEQAAGVVSTALQHFLQAGVWQLQQPGC
jgi:hypothetical protein